MKTICVDGMTVTLRRKRVRRMILHAAPEGAWLSLPLRATVEQAVRFVTAQREWLAAQQRRLQTQHAPDRLVEGERVYLWGRPLTLHVHVQAGGRAVRRVGDEELHMTVPPESDSALRQQLLEDWYRAELQAVLPSVLTRWQQVVGRTARDCRIRSMKTRWGSCTVQTGSIRINLRLVQKPPACLDYVMAHELTHLHVPNHSAAFWDRMDRYYPDWRRVRAMLRQKDGE